jgi:phage tail sheath protein FI
VNVIRPYNGRGVRVVGARTLSDDPLWRYINVRRLLIMIERAIDTQTQWIVFEPNNPTLWSIVDRAIRSFLDRLWRRGMLDGARAEDAYVVQCDAATNPPEETEIGRTVCQIGVQPPWPAEFVIVRIGKTDGGTSFEESGGGASG